MRTQTKHASKCSHVNAHEAHKQKNALRRGEGCQANAQELSVTWPGKMISDGCIDSAGPGSWQGSHSGPAAYVWRDICASVQQVQHLEEARL